MTTHQSPTRGSGTMPCCGRTPFEVPRTDRMTVMPLLVTCEGIEVKASAFTEPSSSQRPQHVDRSGWTTVQWVAEAREIMNSVHGSVGDLLNGHAMAMLRTIDGFRDAKGKSIVRAAADIAATGTLPFDRAFTAVLRTTDLWAEHERLLAEERARRAEEARLALAPRRRSLLNRVRDARYRRADRRGRDLRDRLLAEAADSISSTLDDKLRTREEDR